MLEANQPDQTQIEKTVARWFQGKKTVVEPKQANQQKIAKVRTWLEQNSTRGYAMAYRIFATSDKIFLNKLAKLAMPVLYLTGDNDKNSTPAMSFQMAQLTPHGSSFSIIGEAHIMAYIAPDKVNPILEKFFFPKHSKMNKEQNFNKDFRRALGSFPTGVTVVTTMDRNNKPIGFTANSFTSVSLNPHLILICIGKNSSNIQTFTQAEYFAMFWEKKFF